MLLQHVHTLAAAAALPLLAAALPHEPVAPTTLFVTPQVSSSTPDCLRRGYRGAYGSVTGRAEHVFITSDDCLSSSLELGKFADEGSISALSHQHTNGRRLLWIGESGVRGKIYDERSDRSQLVLDVMQGLQAGYADLAQALQLETSIWHAAAEKVLGVLFARSSTEDDQLSVPGLDFVHVGERSAIVSVDERVLFMLDSLVPSHLSLVALPEDDLPLFSTAESSYGPPVPQHLVDNLRKITKKLKFSPEIDEIVSKGIDKKLLKQDILYLTGEREDSKIETRHSFTQGARDAADWIMNKVQHTGAECYKSPFLPGFAPNVICTYPSRQPNNTELVILSGHYDSRGSFGRIRAPGGDDDGSGSGHVLAIAQAIAKYKIKFEKTVQLVFFAGEEQGLFGSAAYAKQLHQENATILLQTQADMLGYHDPKEPMQLGFPATIGTPEAAWLLGNLSQIYSPELVVGTTAACCSDHQSFVGYGFPATQVFERNGWIADPMYHNSGDLALREGYDFEQIYSIAKVTFAGLLEVADYKRS